MVERVEVSNKFYYGWINMIIASISYFLYVGVLTYAFGIMVKPMAKDLNLSMTMATAGFSGFTLVKALIAPPGGKLVSKYGTKPFLLLGGVAGLAASLTMAFIVKGFISYMFVWIFLVSVSYFGGMVPSQISISKWFFQKRGLAMSIFLTIGGSAGFFFSPIMNKITTMYSWRHCWLLIGACSAVVSIITLLFYKESPKDIGQEIDGGYVESKIDNSINSTTIHKTKELWTISDVRKEKTFYFIIILQLSISFLLTSISNQGVNHMNNLGLERAVAAAVVGTFSLVNTFSRLIIAPFTDKIETKKIVMIGILCVSVGIVFLFNADSIYTAYSFAAFAGLGFGLCMVGPQNMLLNNFGSTDYANISSFYFFITGVLASFNAVIIGFIYDITNSYNAVWSISLGLLTLSFINMILLKHPKLNKN